MHTLWTIIAGIFKWSWRILNFVRQLVANVLFIIILLLAAGAYALLSEQDTQTSREPGALYVNLSGVVVDQLTRNSPLESLSLQRCLARLPVSYRKTPCLMWWKLSVLPPPTRILPE